MKNEGNPAEETFGMILRRNRRVIGITAALTSLFWMAVPVVMIWFGSRGPGSARVQFSKSGDLEVLSGSYRVQVVASNGVTSTVLLDHTARSPERVTFALERLDKQASV